MCVCVTSPDFFKLVLNPEHYSITIITSLHHRTVLQPPVFSGRSRSATGPTAPRHNNHHDCGWPGAFKPMDTVVSLPNARELGLRLKTLIRPYKSFITSDFQALTSGCNF